MASLWKQTKSPYWTACFTAADGRQMKRSTRTKDRRVAMRLANEFETAANIKRTAIQARRVIESLHKELTGEDLPSKPLADFVADWLKNKERETSRSTLHAYKTVADKLLAFLGDKAALDVALISQDDLMRFRNDAFSNRHSSTVNNAIKIVRMIFKAAHRKRLITENPAEFVDTVKQEQRVERRPFKLDELRAMLAVADAEWKSMIYFGLYTGQRLGDVARLTWANVDTETSTVSLATAKTGRRIMLPLAVPLRDFIAALPAGDVPNAPLHPRAFATLKARGNASSLSKQFGELLITAGLRVASNPADAKRGARKEYAELTFHCLRHTASTMLREAGVPDAVVMEYIGHDDPQMSRHYTHVGKDALASAAAKMPSLI